MDVDMLEPMSPVCKIEAAAAAKYTKESHFGNGLCKVAEWKRSCRVAEENDETPQLRNSATL